VLISAQVSERPMSDSSSPQSVGATRRGAPSPLVFNPDTVLPVSLSATSARAHTVNMPHVKVIILFLSAIDYALTGLQRNITRRLKLAKQECDAALQKITNNITQFIEEQIRGKQFEDAQPQSLREPFELQPIELSSAVAHLRLTADDATSDDAGYEAELEGRHSRQGESPSIIRILFALTTAP
jgi:serine/threonine-protein kinase RIM15